MAALAIQLREDVFQERLINTYLDDALYVPRHSVVAQVEAAHRDRACRLLLITGDPGTGKTGLLAWLARHIYPDSLRYFLRYDSQVIRASDSAASFLLAIGQQLAIRQPTLFQTSQLVIGVEEELERIAAGGSAAGLRIGRLSLSPFCRYAIDVKLRAGVVAGELTGIEIEQLDDAMQDPEILQHFALFVPARALLQQQSDACIDIIVDALDELRDAERGLLRWMEDCGELPPNVRLIVAARPGDHLARVRQRQRPWIRELHLAERGEPVPEMHESARRYVGRADVASMLREEGIDPETFAVQLAAKAEGNFLYLRAVQRMIDRAPSREQRQQMLALRDLPDEVEQLYASFLERAFTVDGPNVEVQRGRYVPQWSVAQEILGVLAVAGEPLSVPQIKRLGHIDAGEPIIAGILFRSLGPLVASNEHTHSFYHRTIAELLTDARTRYQHPLAFVDAAEYHRRIADHYLGTATFPPADHLSHVDAYGVRHLAAHLAEAGDIERLRALVTMAPLRDAWMARHAQLERSRAGYLQDLELVWQHAISEDGWNVPLQLACLLIRNGITARAGAIAPAALPLLIRHQRRSAHAVLHDALTLSSEVQQARVLAALAPYLQDEDVEVAWSAAVDIDHRLLRHDAQLAILLAHPHLATASRLDNLWESWQPHWRAMHLQAKAVSEDDEQALLEQLIKMWRLLEEPERVDAAHQLLATAHPGNLALALVQLLPSAGEPSKASLLRASARLISEAPERAISLSAIAEALPQAQREHLEAITRKIVERTWIHLCALSDQQRTTRAHDLAALVRFLTPEQRLEAVRLIERMTALSNMSYALFEILPWLPEAERERVRAEALDIVSRILSNLAVADHVDPFRRVETLIGLLPFLTDDHKRAVLDLALRLTGPGQRVRALLDLARCSDTLPEDAQQRLAAETEAAVAQGSNSDGSNTTEVLIAFALSAAIPVRERALRATESAVERIPERADKGRAMVGLASLYTGERQVSVLCRAVELLHDLPALAVARLLTTAPLLPAEALEKALPRLPRNVAAALKDNSLVSDERAGRRWSLLRKWFGYSAETPARPLPQTNPLPQASAERIRAMLHSRAAARSTEGWLQQLERAADHGQNMPDQLKAELIAVLLTVIADRGHTDHALQIISRLLPSWDGSSFFQDPSRRATWNTLLRAMAGLDRSECLTYLSALLPFITGILAPAEQERVLDCLVDTLE